MSIPFVPQRIYHIYSHANGNENLFRVADNYGFFLKKYQEYVTPVADTFVYCLMPNHFHFLVRIKSENELDKFFQTRNKVVEAVDYSRIVSQQWSHFLNGYSQAYNKMFDRRGSLFQSRIKRKEIKRDNYFTSVILYIHCNPVKHGFVDSPFSWDYSSIHDYLSSSDTFLLKSEVVKWFGSHEQFFILHKEALSSLETVEFE